jgi:GAF domain
MSASEPTSALHRLFENRFASLAAEVEQLLADAREHGRSECAERLNQAARRIRQSADLEQLCALLVDAAGDFAPGAALFRIHGDTAKGERIRGVSEECAEHFQELEIPLEAAPALAGAVESRDPVTTVTSPAEVSARLVALAGHAPDGRATIFPVVANDRVPALVYAWGTVPGPAIELLAQMAGAVWNALLPPPAPEPPLVRIAPAPASAWQSLSPAEQQIHLRAQRFARVHVAGMRLYEPDAVQTGRAQRNLYESLRNQIDSGREQFHKDFFERCPSMVDYFHLELVRTLANDDAEMLGNDYPGPMV